ncbi:hypothetical protein Q5752_004819 [Cryptotrichosporon argae]
MPQRTALPPGVPKELAALLAAPSTPLAYATDAVEEYILHRRAKGDTLFEVSVGLVELEDRAARHLVPAIYAARYMTNVPPPSDLTPPTGPFPLARSQSPSSVAAHLLSRPAPSIARAREVVLEYVFAREARLRDKRPGRGGKGTLGRDGFDDLARRLGEVEDALRAGAVASPTSSPARDRQQAPPLALADLDEPRRVGLMLVLSLRMSLSYFTLQEVAKELLELALGDAERTLVQHIRRRVAGEGRYGVGKELEAIESMTLPQRPALRPTFRSAKARTYLPLRPTYPIPLPSPSKSSCIKHLAAFIRDIDASGVAAAVSYMQPTSPAAYSPSVDRGFLKRGGGGGTSSPGPGGSPRSPLAPLAHFSQAPPQGPPEPGASPIADYALELLSEYLTREKREYMLKNKWAAKGHDQLGRDLGEIEAALCLAGKAQPSAHAPDLLPTFLVLRRTFALPPSPLPPTVTEPYIDILPAPPDPDSVPFREPTVGTTTATLYVNPRLGDAAALDALEELVESEREKVVADGASDDVMAHWVLDLVEQVEKRFPDGSYADVFAHARENILQPRARPDLAPASPHVPLLRQHHSHRRTQSNAVTAATATPALPALASRLSHTRSASMPMRHASFESSPPSSVSSTSTPPPRSETDDRPPSTPGSPSPDSPKPSRVPVDPPQLPPARQLAPLQLGDRPLSSATSAGGGGGGGGWWDVVSAVETEHPSVPWRQSQLSLASSAAQNQSPTRYPLAPGAQSQTQTQSPTRAPLPPGAEAPALTPPADAMADLAPASSAPTTATPATTTDGERFVLDSPPRRLPRARTLDSALVPTRKASLARPAVPRAADSSPPVARRPPPGTAPASAASSPGSLSMPRPIAASASAAVSPASRVQMSTLPNPPRVPLSAHVSAGASPVASPHGVMRDPPHPHAQAHAHAQAQVSPSPRGSPYASPGAGARETSYRPPPVPLVFDRPGWPAGAPAQTQTQTPTPPPSAFIKFAERAADKDKDRDRDRDREDGGTAAKSKLGSFGRSLSIGRKIKGKDKENGERDRDRAASAGAGAGAGAGDKDKDKEKEKEKDRDRDSKVANNPGRWNRDMVAGIMGPPAERR